MKKSEIKTLHIKQKEAIKHIEEFITLDEEIKVECIKNLPKQIKGLKNANDISEAI